MAPRNREHDYDWLVIGSGFGGSVSALRLAEKGYRVAILECGRRFGDRDFANTTWEAAKYYWMPKLGLKGIFRLTLFKDVFVASGCGVGGGSLGYANTLYRARPAFYEDRRSPGSPTGSVSSLRTTTRPSGCSASRRTTRTPRPTCC
jgi:cholesterol oxidase